MCNNEKKLAAQIATQLFLASTLIQILKHDMIVIMHILISNLINLYAQLSLLR
jgi:hypothetical protein